MVCRCWFLLAVTACLCVPGLGSVCEDLSSKGRTLACIHYCLSAIQTEFPKPGSSGLKVNGADDEDDLLLSIILAFLASKDETSGADPKAHSDKRRAYTMEHFRWGKPPGDKTAQPKLRAQSNKRRSYTMEHFRWGKPFGEKTPKLKAHSNGRRAYAMEHIRWATPPGRKRRLVEALTSLDSSEGGTPPLAEADWEPNLAAQRLLRRARGIPKARNRKAGTYRMGHFRWGGPSISKRGDRFMKPWQEKLLLNLLRTIIVKEGQRRTGQRMGRMEEVGGLVK